MEASRTSGIRSARGFTLIELLIVTAIICVLCSIAITQVMRARMAGNEAAAIASLKAVVAGQMDYANSCGRNFYATDLTTLGQPLPGSNAAFLSPDMTISPIIQKSGYEITMSDSTDGNAGPPDCNGNGTSSGFYATSRPLMYQVQGSRSFAIGSAGIVWQEHGSTPPVEPFGPPATPLR